MELIHTDSIRIDRLSTYLSILASGSAIRENWEAYRDVLETATAFEVNAVLHAALSDTHDMSAWKLPVSRFLRATAHSLESAHLPLYEAHHVLASAETGNLTVETTLDALSELSVRVRAGSASHETLITRLGETEVFRIHYEDLQNGLFARFEAVSHDHACVKLMWSLEDDVLAMQCDLSRWRCDDPFSKSTDFWKKFGEFFLLAKSLVWRERFVLFPVAFRALPESDVEPSRSLLSDRQATPADAGPSDFLFSSRTGSLTFDQLEAVFTLLPLDVAFIGPDDRVAFYSDPPHRIFPRSPAVIGRLVQNCHPPKSVAMVEEILRTFKDGSRDRAEFYLEARGAFIHIQYVAVRDKAGMYMGTLEVTQDATHVRSLKGEKRLL